VSGGGSGRLVILHNNDLHFAFHHFAQFRDAVEEIRRTEDNVLLLSGGDVLVRHERAWPVPGDVESYRRRGREMIALMNEAGYDAAVMGNHELYTHGDITAAILKGASFPWLAANIEISGAPLPEPLPHVTLTTAGGLRVLVLGLGIINWEPSPGISESDLFHAVRAHLPLAREHDVFVLLTHRGIRDDIDLANEFPEVDAIIGGHTHNLLTDALVVNDVLIAQTGSLGHEPTPAGPVQLGVAVLELRDGRVVGRCGRVLAITDSQVSRAGSAFQGAESLLTSCAAR